MPNFFKKIFKEVARPFQYAAKTGSTEVRVAGQTTTGGQIISVTTVPRINKVSKIQKNTFEAHLRSIGVPGSAVEAFKPLMWVTVRVRDKIQFSHKINETTKQTIVVAVKRLSQTQMMVSVVNYESKVTVRPPKTIIHKVKTNYGPGWRKSNDFDETIDRGLTAIELKKVMDALENESKKYDCKAMALSNV